MFVAVNLEKKLLSTINVIAGRTRPILKGTRYGSSETENSGEFCIFNIRVLIFIIITSQVMAEVQHKCKFKFIPRLKSLNGG